MAYTKNLAVSSTNRVVLSGSNIQVTGSLFGTAISGTTAQFTSITGALNGSITGNAATVTNGVYTSSDQTIGGVKTFSSTITGSISGSDAKFTSITGSLNGSITGNAATVTNGVYTTGDQTIAGTKTFSSTIAGSINGNSATATKLQTTRALTIGNTAKNFDGSAAVSWTLSEIGAVPGATNTTIQFNSGSTFSGSSDLVWDYTNSRLGIGTSSPAVRLHVSGSSELLRLQTSVARTTGSCYVNFVDPSGSKIYIGYEGLLNGRDFKFINLDVSANTSFYASPDAGLTKLHALSIYPTAKIKIGGTTGPVTPNSTLDVDGDTIITGSLNVTQNITSSADLLISNGNLVIGTSGKGISFANTTPDGTSVGAELLDDYEEGTWTPGLGGSTSNGSYSYGAGNVGTYTKIGDVVYISCQLDATVTTALTGTVHLTGLPFTQNSLERKRSYGIVGEYIGLTTSVANFKWEGIPNQTYVRFNYTTAAATSMTSNLAGTDINRTAAQTITMRLVGFYYV